MNRYLEFFKSVLTIAISLTTLIFTFTPENMFTYGIIQVDLSQEWIIIFNRLILLLLISAITFIGMVVYRLFRKKITLRGSNFTIVVEYGDIFKKSDCKKIINFDECYTTQVGDSPNEIKQDSICGQFLLTHQGINLNELIAACGLKQANKRSKYKNQYCYPSGSLVPFEDYLLLAFAKLDTNGLGRMTREDFLSCLNLMWKEIDKYHASKSVAIPILGSNITRFEGEVLSQQELLDMIIASYKMTPHKLMHSRSLHIVCRKTHGFSLNKVGQYI